MRPVSIESTLLSFLYIEFPWYKICLLRLEMFFNNTNPNMLGHRTARVFSIAPLRQANL